MGNIKSIPILERPREKAFRYGVTSLSNHELIALILGSGTKNHSVLEVANDILNLTSGLGNISRLDYEMLTTIKGISKVRAILLLAVLELFNRLKTSEVNKLPIIRSSQDIYQMYNLKYRNYENEEVVVLMLKSDNSIFKEEIIAKGGINSVDFDYRLLLGKLLKQNTHKFILVHNHPSHNALPSKMDIMVTNEIKEKAKFFNLYLLDHIIISSSGFYSFKDHALL